MFLHIFFENTLKKTLKNQTKIKQFFANPFLLTTL